VYGSPLRLPGEFFAPYLSECTDVTDFTSRLKVHIGKLRPISASWHAAPSTFIFKDLATTSHVFLWHGALRGALQAPYVGPYRVLHRGDKTYTIEVQGAAKTVSIDRLKPAYVLHVDTECFTAGHSLWPHDSPWMTGTLPGLPGDAAVSAGGWCGGHRGLAHPCSQDSLLPTRHLLKKH